MCVKANSTFFGEQNDTDSPSGTTYSFNVWLLSFLLVLTAPVNIVVIHLLSHQRKTIHTCGFTTFAISLAVTDTLVGLISVPGFLVQVYIKHWPFDSVSCLLFLIVDYGFTSVSIFIMAVMAYDRYKCVTSPVSYRVNFKQRRVIVTSVIIWILGIGAWVPFHIVSHFNSDLRRNSTFCTVKNFGYLFIPYNVIMHHLPLIFTVITYVKLVCNLRKRLYLKSAIDRRSGPYMVPVASKAVNQVSGNVIDNSEVTPELSSYHTTLQDSTSAPTRHSTLNYISESSRKQNEPRDSSRGAKYLTPVIKVQNQRCLKTSILVVMNFVFCWGPFCLLWPVVNVCEDCVDNAIYFPISLLCYANSTLNPFIYLATSVQLRQDFKKLICRK